MYTFCPECYTVFEIRATHLSAADGRASCGKCRHVYRAIDYLYEEVDTVWREVADYRLKCEQAAVETGPVFGTMRAASPASSLSAPSPRPGDQTGTPPVWLEQCREAGSAARDKSATEQGGRWYQKAVSLNDVAGGTAVGMLILLLAFQWLYFNQAKLTADDEWRLMVDRVCVVWGCKPALQSDVSQIKLVSREVRRHPRVKDGLLINATLVNLAEFSQAYPVFEITFTGLSGKPVAMRRFQPAEYLGEAASLQDGMPAGLPIQILLEVVDPNDADSELSFQFDFI